MDRLERKQMLERKEREAALASRNNIRQKIKREERRRGRKLTKQEQKEIIRRNGRKAKRKAKRKNFLPRIALSLSLLAAGGTGGWLLNDANQKRQTEITIDANQYDEIKIANSKESRI